MHIASLGRQRSKGDRVKPLFKYGFCEYGSVNKQWGDLDFCNSGVEYRYPIRGIDTQIQHWNLGIGIGTNGEVSVPKPLWDFSIDTGFRVPIPAA
ncbi:hypothetical protein GQ457_18G007790 [Hibiscus cannabinus]